MIFWTSRTCHDQMIIPPISTLSVKIPSYHSRNLRFTCMIAFILPVPGPGLLAGIANGCAHKHAYSIHLPGMCFSFFNNESVHFHSLIGVLFRFPLFESLFLLLLPFQSFCSCCSRFRISSCACCCHIFI